MTSEIRTNSLTSRAGLSTVTLTDTGPMFSGITTFIDNSGFNLGTGSSIFSPASNTLTFGTNSEERVRVDSNGRLLLGTVRTYGTGPYYDDICINNSDGSGSAGGAGIDLISKSDNYGAIVFSNESQHERGYIKFEHNSGVNRLRFGTVGTDRWQIYNDGHLRPASDSAYDIGSSSVRVRNGYFDTLYGDGSNLVNLPSSGTSLSGSTNNTVCTVTGANAIQGESTLTYDGNKLKFGGGTRALDNGYYDDIVIDNSDTTSGEAGGSGISIISGNASWGGLIFGDNDHHQRGYIKYYHGDDYMQIVTASGGGEVRIKSTGEVNIGGDYDQTAYNLSVTNTGGNLLRLKTANEGDYDLRFMIQNSESNIWHYGTDDFVFGNRYDRKLHFITNAQKRLTIHGNYVGINDTAPSYTLNVIGDNTASNGIGMLKGIIGVQNDTTAFGSSPTAGISFQTKYRTGPDVPLDVAAIWGGKENTTNGDKDGYMGFAVREEGGSGSQERMRITSDGNLIIGHTSGSNKLQIGNTGHSGYCIAANSPSYGAVIQVGDGATPGTAAALWVRNLNNGGGTESCFRVQGDSTVHFGNQTSITKYNDGAVGCSWYDDKQSWQQGQEANLGWSMMYFNKKSGSDDRIMHFFNNGTTCGFINRVSGNSTTQFATSSDYRLKKDIVALPNGIERVKKLRPVAFKWKNNNGDMEGFLAHEAQEIVPYAVSGKKDEVALEDHGDKKKGDMIIQGVDYGEFTPLLTAAMKELIAKVETLENKVNDLENKLNEHTLHLSPQ